MPADRGGFTHDRVQPVTAHDIRGAALLTGTVVADDRCMHTVAVRANRRDPYPPSHNAAKFVQALAKQSLEHVLRQDQRLPAGTRHTVGPYGRQQPHPIQIGGVLKVDTRSGCSPSHAEAFQDLKTA